MKSYLNLILSDIDRERECAPEFWEDNLLFRWKRDIRSAVRDCLLTDEEAEEALAAVEAPIEQPVS